MQTRRDVLRMGAGAAGASVLTSLAGCSNVPVVGSYFDDGIDYTEWTYDPDELESVSVSATLMHVADILDTDDVPNKGNLREDVTENYGGELMADDVEYYLTVDQSEILTGSFDGDDLVEGMELSSEEGYGDFDIYVQESAEAEETDALIATDGDYLLRSNPHSLYEFDAREQIELLIDTYNGDADRLIDSSDNFEQVNDEIGSGVITSTSMLTDSEAETVEDDELVATATVADLDGEDVVGTLIWLFKHEDGVDLDEIESEFEGGESGVELDDLSQDGRMAIVEFTLPADEFL